jgi:hypothetical protein
MEIHHDEVTGEYVLMCGLGNTYEFTTPTIHKKILTNESDAETLGQESLRSYGTPSWAIITK